MSVLRVCWHRRPSCCQFLWGSSDVRLVNESFTWIGSFFRESFEPVRKSCLNGSLTKRTESVPESNDSLNQEPSLLDVSYSQWANNWWVSWFKLSTNNILTIPNHNNWKCVVRHLNQSGHINNFLLKPITRIVVIFNMNLQMAQHVICHAGDAIRNDVKESLNMSCWTGSLKRTVQKSRIQKMTQTSSLWRSGGGGRESGAQHYKGSARDVACFCQATTAACV